MKNSPKKPAQDQGSNVPQRTDKRDPSQPPVKRDQPQGQKDMQPNRSGQQPRREDERPLKEDRQPVAGNTQRDMTVAHEKGKSTAAQKNAPPRDIDADEDDFQEDEEMDEIDLTDEEEEN